FLDEEMTAGVRGALRDLEMPARRSADEHGVGPGGDRLVELREHGRAELAFDVARIVALERLGDDVTEAPAAERQQLEIGAEDRPQIARMTLSDRAKSRDEHPHCTSPRAA